MDFIFCDLQVDRMDDKSGSEGSDSDASTSASDEEEEADDGAAAPARKRAASNKARAAALDILQGQNASETVYHYAPSIVFSSHAWSYLCLMTYMFHKPTAVLCAMASLVTTTVLCWVQQERGGNAKLHVICV